ncbi:unnamed protein product [Calicophoron daubneyi]|uniref:RRM domain-containing protein n=1 Tax=Calicophoron daubneyi TaxID=300641 RepID=A0AAV2TNG9_CALDB
MKRFPLIIDGWTAIRILLNGRITHFLYAKHQEDGAVVVRNVHPFMDKESLLNLFRRFGKVRHIDLRVNEAVAIVFFKSGKPVKKVLSNSMHSRFSVDVAQLLFPGPSRYRDSEWIRDYQAAKKESEIALEEYFRRRIEERSKIDEDGWITVNKKRRL